MLLHYSNLIKSLGVFVCVCVCLRNALAVAGLLQQQPPGYHREADVRQPHRVPLRAARPVAAAAARAAAAAGDPHRHGDRVHVSDAVREGAGGGRRVPLRLQLRQSRLRLEEARPRALFGAGSQVSYLPGKFMQRMKVANRICVVARVAQVH